MVREFPNAADKAALLEAVRHVESRSSAEVVIAVRPSSGSYRLADLVLGLLFGYASLWFMLFSPWEFTQEEILAGPLAIGALGAILCARAPLLRRLLTPRATRRRNVATAARSAFVEKGVSRTRRRTGLLVYVSLLEGQAEVVADVGVLDRVPTKAWAEAVASIDASVARGEDGTRLGERIRALADLLAPVLPHDADDVNELPDGIES